MALYISRIFGVSNPWFLTRSKADDAFSRVRDWKLGRFTYVKLLFQPYEALCSESIIINTPEDQLETHKGETSEQAVR